MNRLLLFYLVFLTFAKADVLKVGVGFGIIPFVYDNERGELVGFDIDIVNELGKVLGYDIDFVQMDFSALIPAVQSGKIDLLATAMTITKKRAEQVDFSIPYSSGPGSVILTSIDNDDIKNIRDLKGKKVAVIVGGANADYLRDNKIGAKIVEFPSSAECHLALLNNKVDASINPLESAKRLLSDKGRGRVKIVGKEIPVKGIGMAIRKGNEILLNKINNGIRKIIENGKRDELEKKYFSKLTEDDKKLLN
ncbi:MAG: transporter substrate-binding domain-containing protein [Rickettsiales bacterium]|jgi:ABC-type amino acid transport substrate-binding protein|nr:transporter substrate-binding domain-containing protein [Rickettsiales bacterium]